MKKIPVCLIIALSTILTPPTQQSQRRKRKSGRLKKSRPPKQYRYLRNNSIQCSKR